MASAKRSAAWPIISVLVALVIGTVALPKDYKGWAPSFLRNTSLHFGLDLAGGTQLDFRISEQEINEQIAELEQQVAEMEASNINAETIAIARQQLASVKEQKLNIVEAIRTVLERRINALGVSEAIITPSYFGNEKHLLVECPGVVDTQECIDTVGKTIQLEFKEEFNDPTPEFESEVTARAEAVVERVTTGGEALQVVGQDLGDELGILYNERRVYFQDQLPAGLEERWNHSREDGIFNQEGTITIQQQDANGQLQNQEVPGIFVVEVLGEKTQTGRIINEAPAAFSLLEDEVEGSEHIIRLNVALDSNVPSRVIGELSSMQNGDLRVISYDNGDASVLFRRNVVASIEEMEASHILVAYEGATSAGEEVTRTKEEALTFAQELAQQLASGADFAELAQEHSDGPSGADGGSLGTFGRGAMVPQFEAAAFALQEGEISAPTETAFGYHLIRADKVLSGKADTGSYDEFRITGDDAYLTANEVLARMERGDVQEVEDTIEWRMLFFSLLPTGWKDTALDGKHFQSATVTLDPVTNIPVVQIAFDDEGGKLFGELTKNNVGKRIAIFVGGELVSAPVVQTEITGGIAIISGSQSFEEARLLAQDLNTGAIPAPIYLAGQRTVEATLGAEALRTSLNAALIGVMILMVYMILVYRMLGVIADIALMGYAVIFLAILKMPLFLLSDQHIVLTLAGMAGIILSIGMAVDANVLIFERMKEELRKGKMLKTAAETGFQRAWPSIRDGNMSTFITCAILFIIGTSIIRGFAITLGMGVLISMFSAIVVTRWLIKVVASSPLAERTGLFGA